MQEKIFTPRFIFISTLILLAALTRLMPHPYNFTAIGAMALFGGAVFNRISTAFFVPLAAMLVSDAILGFHLEAMLGVYTGFALMVVVGLLIGRNINVSTVAGGAMLGSVIFFLVTNFAAWIGSPLYPQTAEGLWMSYAAGVSFYSQDFFGSFFFNSVMANLFYSALLFGMYRLAEARFPKLAKIRTKK